MHKWIGRQTTSYFFANVKCKNKLNLSKRVFRFLYLLLENENQGIT
jgi:hypothetical protein